VAAHSVIEPLNILKHRFDRMEKALLHRIVGTMLLAAHAANRKPDPVSFTYLHTSTIDALPLFALNASINQPERSSLVAMSSST
jgi:hypothetical protein